MTLAALALVSAGVLAYEVVLTRALAIAHWDPVGPMVISIALLGFGVSGTALTLAGERVARHFDAVFSLCAVGFGVTAVAGFVVGGRLDLEIDRLLWDPAGLVRLPLLYLCLALPFALGATCIGAALICLPAPVGRIYRYDLFGAGAGAMLVMLAMTAADPGTVVLLAGALGPVAAAVHLGPHRRRLATMLGIVTALALALALGAELSPAVSVSEFKPLARTLTLPGTRIGAERHSPRGWVAVVESPQVPLRHAPGTSLNSPHQVPAQAALFTDGAALQAITAFDGDLAALAYLDFTTAALPYHLWPEPQVAITDAGAGRAVLMALHHRARAIAASEPNGDVVELVDGTYGGFSGAPYARPGVHTTIGPARAALRGRHDLVVIALIDGELTASRRALLTVEGLRDALGAVRESGGVAITVWLDTPPRAALKLVNTVVAALRAHGVEHPLEHLAAVRDWSTLTLVARRKPFDDEDVVRVRRFADARAFDLVHVPGMRPDEANRHNVLPGAYLADGVRALGGNAGQAYVERFKFDISAPTDERPFFHDTFRWAALAELLALPAQGGAALLEWGYLVAWLTLAQTLVLAVGLIAAPLWLGARRARSPAAPAVLAGFGSLGVAFLLVEVAMMQRLGHLLGDPVLAFVVVVASFLVFAGLGAGYSAAPGRRWLSAPRVTVAVAVIASLYAVWSPVWTDWLIALAPWQQIAIGVMLIAPVAFCMGMPFPLALARVRATRPALAPWAWGINGCGSVISPVLALVLAMDFGIDAVLLAGALAYLCAGLALARADAVPSGIGTEDGG